MSALLQDLRYAWRSLGHRPGFAAVAILTLALGIGLNAAVFSVVDAALVRSVPYAEPARLVHLGQVPVGLVAFPFANQTVWKLPSKRVSTTSTPGPQGTAPQRVC